MSERYIKQCVDLLNSVNHTDDVHIFTIGATQAHYLQGWHMSDIERTHTWISNTAQSNKVPLKNVIPVFKNINNDKMPGFLKEPDTPELMIEISTSDRFGSSINDFIPLMDIFYQIWEITGTSFFIVMGGYLSKYQNRMPNESSITLFFQDSANTMMAEVVFMTKFQDEARYSNFQVMT